MLPPDVATMDLAEAPRILGGGNGLDSEQRFDTAHAHRHHAGCVGGHHACHHRQGMAAPQPPDRHDRAWWSTRACTWRSASRVRCSTPAGWAGPDHIISVNTEPHCPMMGLADLAIVADANATLDALESALASLGRRARTEARRVRHIPSEHR